MTSQTPASKWAAQLAANIRAERARADIDQEALAAGMTRLGYKWARQTVGEVEKGRRRVLAEELLALAFVLGCSVDRFLDGLA